jgi:hypothetical protein
MMPSHGAAVGGALHVSATALRRFGICLDNDSHPPRDLYSLAIDKQKSVRLKAF